jgi:hypothetical protein
MRSTEHQARIDALRDMSAEAYAEKKASYLKGASEIQRGVLPAGDWYTPALREKLKERDMEAVRNGASLIGAATDEVSADSSSTARAPLPSVDAPVNARTMTDAEYEAHKKAFISGK